MGILPPPFSHRLPVVTAPISCPRGTPRSSALSHPTIPSFVFFSTAPPRSARCIFILCAGELRCLFFRNSTCRSGSAPSFSRASGGEESWAAKAKMFLLFTNQEQTTDVIRGKQQKLLNNNNNNNTTLLCLISPSHTSIFSPVALFFLHSPPSPSSLPQAPSAEPPLPTSSLLVFFLFHSEVGRVGGWLGEGGGALCVCLAGEAACETSTNLSLGPC